MGNDEVVLRLVIAARSVVDAATGLPGEALLQIGMLDAMNGLAGALEAYYDDRGVALPSGGEVKG